MGTPPHLTRSAVPKRARWGSVTAERKVAHDVNQPASACGEMNGSAKTRLRGVVGCDGHGPAAVACCSCLVGGRYMYLGIF